MHDTHEMDIRVRYSETDAQGVLHHANFINYFEMGRTEQMRRLGTSYREFERSGLMLVVTRMTCEYLLPVLYDDLVRLRTTTTRCRGARIDHIYEISRDGEILARGQSTLACLSADGRPTRLPDWMQVDP